MQPYRHSIFSCYIVSKIYTLSYKIHAKFARHGPNLSVLFCPNIPCLFNLNILFLPFDLSPISFFYFKRNWQGKIFQLFTKIFLSWSQNGFSLIPNAMHACRFPQLTIGLPEKRLTNMLSNQWWWDPYAISFHIGLGIGMCALSKISWLCTEPNLFARKTL